MALVITASYIENTTSLFRYYKELAEGAIEQVSDSQLSAVLDPRMNSIAVMVKHLAGNMKSRWTDFLTTDGEKNFRDRADEFRDPQLSRDDLMKAWDEAWACAFATLATLTDEDLGRIVTIKGEAHSVLQAISRQVTHVSYHAGQIVFLAKHLADERWKPLKAAR